MDLQQTDSTGHGQASRSKPARTPHFINLQSRKRLYEVTKFLRFEAQRLTRAWPCRRISRDEDPTRISRLPSATAQSCCATDQWDRSRGSIRTWTRVAWPGLKSMRAKPTSFFTAMSTPGGG